MLEVRPQPKQVNAVLTVSEGLAKELRDIIDRPGEVHDRSIGIGLLDDRHIAAGDILGRREDERPLIIDAIQNDAGYIRLVEQAQGTKAPLAGDDLVFVTAATNHHGLPQTVLADTVGKLP